MIYWRQCPLWGRQFFTHYNDVTMGAIASQITSLTHPVYSIVYSDADQRKHQSSTSLAFVRGIQQVHCTGEFPAQRASNAEIVSLWWRHHVFDTVNNSSTSITNQPKTKKVLLHDCEWSPITLIQRMLCTKSYEKYQGRNNHFRSVRCISIVWLFSRSLNINPLARASVWIYLFGGFFRVLTVFLTNQHIVQRFCIVKTPRDARK